MTEAEIEALLTDFTNRLRLDQPLNMAVAADAALYVNGLHGGADAVGRLRRDILRLHGGGVFLFTGQPGSGKSTELRCLQRDLIGEGCKVYYCDMQEWLNLNAPITLSSFLLALLSSWVDQIGTVLGTRSPAQRLVDLFTRTKVIPENFKLDANVGMLKGQLQLALQADTNFRRDLEINLKQQLSSVVAQVHRLVAEIKQDLCARGERCVLLADSIEKIRGYGEEADAVYQSVQSLFVNEGTALQLPGVHVLYSVAPYLLDQNNHLAASLGTGFVVNMPSVHVYLDRSRTPDMAGLMAVQALLAARFPRWPEVFVAEQVTRMAQYTGGDLRDFLRSVRVALSDDIRSLPVSDSTVEYALSHISPSRNIPGEHVGWLARVETSHESMLDGAIDGKLLQRYLASKHVLAYQSDMEWLAVHPMLVEWVKQRASMSDIAVSAAAALASTAATSRQS